MFLYAVECADAQEVSPAQGGHYSPAVANIRDRAIPPPGLFVLWHNGYTTGITYIDYDGRNLNTARLYQIYPWLPTIDVSLELSAIAGIPNVYWASQSTVRGGARYMAGVSFNYDSADVSVNTEKGGIT